MTDQPNECVVECPLCGMTAGIELCNGRPREWCGEPACGRIMWTKQGEGGAVHVAVDPMWVETWEPGLQL